MSAASEERLAKIQAGAMPTPQPALASFDGPVTCKEHGYKAACNTAIVKGPNGDLHHGETCFWEMKVDPPCYKLRNTVSSVTRGFCNRCSNKNFHQCMATCNPDTCTTPHGCFNYIDHQYVLDLKKMQEEGNLGILKKQRYSPQWS